MTALIGDKASVLVIGAGISGITAALEVAETGKTCVLIEQEAWVGGRVMRLNRYFPKYCPPSCGMEINTKRLFQNRRVSVLTGTTLKSATKAEAGWNVLLERKPSYVSDACTMCGACVEVCPKEVPNPFNLGKNNMKAVGWAHADVQPKRAFIARSACPEGCDKCKQVCTASAIDLDAKTEEISLTVGAVVNASGWKPYPKDKLDAFGGGKIDDVMMSVEMERIASKNGPTKGRILKQNGEPPKKVAFVQCAGSRDVSHLAYCSGVCCLASLKQARYVKEQIPDAEVTVYYIDRRTPGRNEDVLTLAVDEAHCKLVKGKVGKIEKKGDMLCLRVEDVDSSKIIEVEADMAVLAVGMVPSFKDAALPIPFLLDEDGFCIDDMESGLIAAGCAKRPDDVAGSVRDATGAAMKALVCSGRM
jgi:quinone-modifying oxidoreductase subunit QmoA